MEARVSLKGLGRKLSQGLLSLCQSPEPMLVWMFRFPKVREIWGAFGLWEVIYYFIFLLSAYYASGPVLTPVK